MKRKAHTAFACEVCSRGGAPACFMSDADLARHKRSASHLQQQRVALARLKYNSVTSAPSPAAHADHGPLQVEHCPLTPCCSPVILEMPEYCALSEHLYADLVCMHVQALAGPQGTAEASLQQAHPDPAAMQAHHGALPDLGQSALEDGALPLNAPPLMHDAVIGAALGDAVAADTGLPRALHNPRAQLEPCLLPSHSAGVQRVHTVSEEEAIDLIPGRPSLTPVETALLPALIKTSGSVIDTLLRNLHEALGPTLLRWGCLKDFEERFMGCSGTVSLPRRACPHPCDSYSALRSTAHLA